MWSFPLDRGGGAGDRDAALLLQLHVVHGRAVAAALDLLDPVDAAGVEQDPLAERGLARVDVGGDADVAQFFQVHVCVRKQLGEQHLLSCSTFTIHPQLPIARGTATAASAIVCEAGGSIAFRESRRAVLQRRLSEVRPLGRRPFNWHVTHRKISKTDFPPDSRTERPWPSSNMENRCPNRHSPENGGRTTYNKRFDRPG